MIDNAYIFEAVAKREITPRQGAEAMLALDYLNKPWYIKVIFNIFL